MKRNSQVIGMKVVVVLCLVCSIALVNFGQDKASEKKEQDPKVQETQKPATASSSENKTGDKTVEYEEVRSPFGVQRVPKRAAGGSPFQQPAAPSAAPSTSPATTTGGAAATQATPTQTAPNVQAPTATQPPASPQVPASPPAGADATAAQTVTDSGANVGFVCVNCDLLEFIRNVGAELKLNYIIDPRIKGVVTIHTYGELKREDLLPVLETVLRINGAAIVKTGNFYQVVPSASARQLPLPLRKPGEEQALPPGDAKVLQIVPMRFLSASEMVKILEPYVSEGSHVAYHAQGNILLITENANNLKKLMDLIDLFDTDVFQNKRVQLYQVKYNRAKDLLSDLEKIFSTYALSSKDSAIKFIAVDRLNGILAVAPNPTSAAEVEKWILKLDQPIQNMGVRNYVYKIENSDAKKLEPLLLRLYGRQLGTGPAAPLPQSPMPGTTPAPAGPGPAPLGMEAADKDITAGTVQGEIKIVADDLNNALIVRCSPQDYEVVRDTIRKLDIVPRQVLIDVKIYEVVLSGNLSMGVSAFLKQRSDANKITTASFSSAAAEGRPGGFNLSTFANVGLTRELLVFLNAQETRSRSRVLSAPSVIASDNVEAHIQVGQEVPILTAQGVVPGGTGGGSLFTNSVQNRSTGIILSVTPRINPSGWVTLKVNQEVSTPGPPPEGSSIASPSINIRSVGTQVTVKDGETIAIGGIISEVKGLTKNRVPLLGDIPGMGLLFGNTSNTTNRTELIALITPKMIEDIDQAYDLTEEFKSQLKSLRKELRALDQQSQ